MRLRRNLTAAALACAAAAGVAGATTAARAQSATSSAAPAPAPRPVEVTARAAEPAPAPTPAPVPAPAPAPVPETSSSATSQEPTVHIDRRTGATIQLGPDDRVIVGRNGDSNGTFRLAQAAPARVDPQRPSPDAPEQQRAIELYRAHFGGQLTKASYLGVSTSHVPGALRQHLSLPEGVGLVVDFVEEDSPAKTAGLKQYDILTKLNDQVLVNAHQLAVLVRSFKPGEEVKLTLIRGGKEQTLSAKLVEKEVKPLDDLMIWEGLGNTFSPDPNEWRKADDPRRPDAARRAPSELPGRRPPDPRAPNNPWQPREIGRPGNNAPSRRTMTVWRDDDTTLTISRLPDGGHHLHAADKSGKVLFDGRLDDEKKRAGLPPQIAQKVRELEAKIAPRGADSGDVFTPAPPRKPDAPPAAENRNDNDNQNDDDNDNEQEDADGDGYDDDKGDAPRARGRSPAPIGRDDLLNISIVNVHGPGVETLKTTRVRDGRVNLPYVAPVVAQGMTEAELEKRIATLYAEAKVAPNVNVSVTRVRATPEEGAPK